MSLQVPRKSSTSPRTSCHRRARPAPTAASPTAPCGGAIPRATPSAMRVVSRFPLLFAFVFFRWGCMDTGTDGRFTTRGRTRRALFALSLLRFLFPFFLSYLCRPWFCSVLLWALGWFGLLSLSRCRVSVSFFYLSIFSGVLLCFALLRYNYV